jgi:hypothetical protein
LGRQFGRFYPQILKSATVGIAAYHNDGQEKGCSRNPQGPFFDFVHTFKGGSKSGKSNGPGSADPHFLPTFVG